MKLNVSVDTESNKVIDSIQISLKYLDGTIDNVEKKVASSPVFSNPIVKAYETTPVLNTETQAVPETQPTEQSIASGAFGATY